MTHDLKDQLGGRWQASARFGIRCRLIRAFTSVMDMLQGRRRALGLFVMPIVAIGIRVWSKTA